MYTQALGHCPKIMLYFNWTQYSFCGLSKAESMIKMASKVHSSPRPLSSDYVVLHVYVILILWSKYRKIYDQDSQ